MRRTAVALLCLSLALAGCKAKEIAEKDAISNDLDKRGTTDLMKEVANDEYTPPADGRLTEAQVQMYLKVREHEKKIVEVAKAEMKDHAKDAEKNGEKSLSGMMDSFKALGSAADLMTADIRAAKDLGYNSQEYLWIKKQILTVSTSEMAQKFNSTIASNMDKAYAEAKKAHDEATDESTKKLYADVLAGYEKSRQEMQASQTEDPATAYNRQILSKYESALNAYAAELAKFEEKPGDAQKAVDELKKLGEQPKNP